MAVKLKSNCRVGPVNIFLIVYTATISGHLREIFI